MIFDSFLTFFANFLFILFYDQSRHNPYLPSLFTTKCIILKSTIKINFFGKYIYLGIKERDESNKDYDLLTELLIGFIRIISKKIFKNDYLTYFHHHLLISGSCQKAFLLV